MWKNTPKTMGYFVGNEWSKNQYQNLNVHTRESTTLRSLFGSTIIGLCLMLLILSLWNITRYQSVNTHVFYLNTRQSFSHATSKKFLSFGLDSSLLREMKHFPIADKKFITLARHLSPAFVRFGGTSADCLFFNQSVESNSTKIFDPVTGEDISNFTITDRDFKSLYYFSKKAGLRMIFDLNVLIRNPNGSWNITNAQDIILYAKGHDMELDWQLGNEPNSFHHVFNVTITAAQLAKDYRQLRYLLNKYGYDASFLVGPEVNHVGDVSRNGEHYVQTFLENNGKCVDYVTWHQYYLNGRECTVKDFINPDIFNALPQQIKSMMEAVNASGNNIPMWLSETSTAFGGGAPELSDRFVAGFLWLDKLGYSASVGVNVVTRQSLFGGNYAMIGNDILPNPDWWVSVIFKQFVSEKVLTLVSANNFGRVRLYAHCTPEKALINRVPATTIYGVNINDVPAHITIQGIFPVNRNIKIFMYALTSDHLQSREIRMNGEPLKLKPNGDLPPFRPIILEPTQVISLPPYSMVFLVIHEIAIPACSI